MYLRRGGPTVSAWRWQTQTNNRTLTSCLYKKKKTHIFEWKIQCQHLSWENSRPISYVRDVTHLDISKYTTARKKGKKKESIFYWLTDSASRRWCLPPPSPTSSSLDPNSPLEKKKKKKWGADLEVGWKECATPMRSIV
jgi:hypothetical protein